MQNDLFVFVLVLMLVIGERSRKDPTPNWEYSERFLDFARNDRK